MEDAPLTSILPGAAQIFPLGPSSAGQHPGHSQEGKNSPGNPGTSLCREKEVCALCLSCPFGTEAVTTRTLTQAQPPERSEIKLLL